MSHEPNSSAEDSPDDSESLHALAQIIVKVSPSTLTEGLPIAMKLSATNFNEVIRKKRTSIAKPYLIKFLYDDVGGCIVNVADKYEA